jgi:hypothetical protein
MKQYRIINGKVVRNIELREINTPNKKTIKGHYGQTPIHKSFSLTNRTRKAKKQS